MSPPYPRRQKGLNVAIPFRPGTGALHLLIGSTGIKSEREEEWFANKHGPSNPWHWRKVHLGIDADTLEIRAIKVTGSGVGDAHKDWHTLMKLTDATKPHDGTGLIAVSVVLCDSWLTRCKSAWYWR